MNQDTETPCDTMMNLPVAPDKLPASYRFRISHRARHVRISVSAYGQVTITHPAHVSRSEAAAFVHSKREWILRQLAKTKPLPRSGTLDRLHLPLTGETFFIRHQELESSRAGLRQKGNVLHLRHDANAPETIRWELREWLKKYARNELAKRLDALCAQTDLSYQKLSIRLQRTRWGSCTREGAISLNAKLMFLKENLVRHVLIHELAHTVHLNHSQAFWHLVACYDPNWREHRKSLRQAVAMIPAWLDCQP